MTKDYENGADEGGPIVEPTDYGRHEDLKALSPQQLIAEYLKLRNWKEAETEKFDAYVKEHAGDRMKLIEARTLGFLNEIGSDKFGARGVGTAHKQRNVSCRITDPASFQRHVIGGQLFDLIDWRANKTSMKEIVEKGEELPPGIDYQVYPVVRFRKG